MSIEVEGWKLEGRKNPKTSLLLISQSEGSLTKLKSHNSEHTTQNSKPIHLIKYQTCFRAFIKQQVENAQIGLKPVAFIKNLFVRDG